MYTKINLKSEPLWSQERIENKAEELCKRMPFADAMGLLVFQICMEYEQERMKLLEENATLRQQRDSWQVGYGQAVTERDEEREKWILAEIKLAELRKQIEEEIS